MKIIIASAGLGNMMFQYAMVLAYRNMGVKCVLFVSEANAHHNGYELEEVFHLVNPYKEISLFGRLLFKFLGQIRKIRFGKKRYFPHYLMFFPFHRIHVKTAYQYCPELLQNLNRNDYILGQFQSYKYFENCRSSIIHDFSFDDSKLSVETVQMLNRIRETNSISVHVRRGDYLGVWFFDGLGSVCTKEYYKRSFEYIKKNVPNPHFFIFSDDKEYIKKNMAFPNCTFVDFNKEKDSWQDLYLMSKCKHNIIANSSFSWWGAWLNQNERKIVIAPKRWWSSIDNDDVVPPLWIRL
jgi:hypothetical protein